MRLHRMWRFQSVSQRPPQRPQMQFANQASNDAKPAKSSFANLVGTGQKKVHMCGYATCAFILSLHAHL